MNEQKVRSEIERLTTSNPYRQYPANKSQAAKLAELSLAAMMPQRFLGSGNYGVGNLDAKMVIEAAEDAGGMSIGGFTAYGDGDVVRTSASALYRALHETEPVTDDKDDEDDEDDEPVEVARYAYDDPSAEDGEQFYIVYLRDGQYEVDAEWSDGPAAIFDYNPTEAEVEVIHLDYLEAVRLNNELGRLEAEVAAIEQRKFEEREATVMEQHLAVEARMSELRPLADFAHLAPPDTLRRAALEGRLEAEKLGRDWLTTERDVRNYLRSRYHTSKRTPN